jgi:uncharacterized protein
MYIADPTRPPGDVFLYTLIPTRLAMLTEGATDEEKRLAGLHWAYSQDLLSRGVMLYAGRTLVASEGSFAFAAVRAASLEEARTVFESDPAVAGGVFRGEVYPFQPMLIGSWPGEA